MALSYEDIVQGAYSSIGRTGMGNAAGQIDPEGYNFWLDALKAGVVSPDQLYANFNKSVAETIQQKPQVANSQAVASYLETNPLATQIDPKKVLAIGDSTTWGYNQGNQVAENMVTTAQKALGSDYSVSNLGINSTTAGDFLNSADFDKALSSGAGTVVLNYGMNEAYRNEDPTTFANNLLTAVQTLQSVGKKVILQTPNSTGVSAKPEDAWTQNVGTYADVVRSVAQQTGTTLDDKFTYTGNLSNATSATDIVHPTAATYGLLGNNLADAIKTTTTGVAPKNIAVTPPAEQAALAPKLVAQTSGSATQNQPATSTPPSAVDTLKGQILGQNLTSQWTGQGYGSAEANAEAIAKLLSDAGITDIKQFGKVDKYEPVDVIGKTYNGNKVYLTGADEYGNGGGSYYYSKPTGETDYEGNPIYQTVPVPQGAKLDNLYGVVDVYGEGYTSIDPSKVVVRDGVPTTVTGQTFGNKVTGEAIESGSGRWQNQGGEGLFSGTGEGKGNTAFRAEFAPDGTPIFYTTQGSSSDVSKGLMTALSLAAGYFAPGVGNALLGAGANQIAAGALGGSLLGGGLAAATGQNVLKGALTGGIGGAGSAYLGNAFGDTAAGFGPQTDASFLAADAAQLAKQGISQSQIVDILSSSGYGSTAAANLAASMAVNGLDVGAMTDQLNNLSSNTGLMSQTGSSADFLAADALQLQGQVGNNFAAIEQNLIASGVDPLIAADVSQQLAFNPGLTQAQLATNLSNSFGNNIYDVNMAATYPTSVLPGSGGLLSDVAGVGGATASTGAVTSTGSGASTAATGSGSGLTTSQIANLATAGLNVAGLLGVTSALSGGTGGSRSVGALPTQGVPLNTADYFNAIQQNYNRLLPAVPRDVATPLAQWYNSQYGA